MTPERMAEAVRVELADAAVVLKRAFGGIAGMLHGCGWCWRALVVTLPRKGRIAAKKGTIQ